MTNYKLLKDAYYGEGGFAAGGYLIKHKRENDDNYTDRQTISYYENYFANVVNALVDPIFRKPQLRNWNSGISSNQLFTTFMDDVDNAGTKLQPFMQDAALKAKLLGAVFICVENFREQEPTVAAAAAARNLPYAYTVEPEFVKDYRLDKFGRLEYFAYEEQCETGASKTTTKAVEFDREIIRVRINGVIVEEVEHGLGQIPVVYFPAREGSRKTIKPASEMEPQARMAKNLYNKQSWLDEILKNQTFSLLLLPDSAAKDINIGTNNALSYDAENTNGAAPSFIAPPDGPAKTLLEQIKTQAENMYRISGLAFIVGAKAEASGVAKAWDFDRVNQTLASFAARCAQAELGMIKIFQAWLQIDVDYTVEYAKDFGIVDVQQEIQTAQGVLDLQLGDGLRVEVLKKVLNTYLPELPSDVFDTIVNAVQEAQRNNNAGED